MKFRIVNVGKIKDECLKRSIEGYIEKISYDAKIEVHEIKDSDKKTEGEKIVEYLEKLKDNHFIFALTEEGNSFSSVEFSKKIKTLSVDGFEIIFIIGGPFGLSDAAKKESNALLSLSDMTYTHEMCYLFLAEQIYRAVSIINGKNYHKG